MRMKSAANKDILAGVIFILFGLLTHLKSRDYEIGSALDMGPGYFPAALGIVLVVLGLIGILRGLTIKIPDPITPHKLEPLFLIFAGIMAFSFLIDRAGLFVASAALIGIACFRSMLANPIEILVIYLTLTGFCAFVFVYLFEMQLPLFWFPN